MEVIEMTRIHATFDGHVLHPEEASVLEPNRRYLLTVEDAPATGEPTNAPYPLAAIAAQATDLGVSDMAEHHDDYAHRR
jgi:hypothetical protein